MAQAYTTSISPAGSGKATPCSSRTQKGSLLLNLSTLGRLVALFTATRRDMATLTLAVPPASVR